MAQPDSVSVVIPAYNEASAIADVVRALAAAAPWREVIVVDDGSSDETSRFAGSAGAVVVRHPYNKGNGAAVKSGIRRAAGEYVLIVDGDGQHSPADAERLVRRLGEYDLVIGARNGRTQATLARRAGNALLNAFAGYLTGRRIDDLTSGFRAARREHLLEFLHLLPNGFSTPTTTTLAFMKAGYNVAKFFVIILKIVTLFSPLRVFLPIALATFAFGCAYGIWNVIVHSRIPNGAVLLILFSVVVFLVGLVSEQIAALRFEGGARSRG